MALVDYSSESDSDSRKRPSLTPPPPPKRAKKLPSLPATFDTAPKDDPSLHQGRTRSRPFVDGEYNTHVYLSLAIPPLLLSTLKELLSSFPSTTNPLHPLLPDLHISLTRPLPLRRHQTKSFTDDLKAKFAKEVPAFRLSLAGRVKEYFSEIHVENGQGRGFLALRVGAGAAELKEVVDKTLDPLLKMSHLPTYHNNPEFHTSFAWTLLGQEEIMALGDALDEEVERPPEKCLFSQELLDKINDRFEERLLAAQPTGGWLIDSVELKISKDITTIPLRMP
ncbi:hypothetical protein B9479_000171 [Cryptococcus floricola]|uniref:U6 snRNA phosphodiesterase 1 n=1 Tax=Cryptococcus floricola TaxID=2591691 RepID=A0A5D3B8H7_9TREE|nr:hypothetical protein B9479_000171 [Cryptococcus floricola]